MGWRDVYYESKDSRRYAGRRVRVRIDGVEGAPLGAEGTVVYITFGTETVVWVRFDDDRLLDFTTDYSECGCSDPGFPRGFLELVD